MADEICKKQKVVPCNNNCYIINLNKSSHTFTDHEHKILRDLCQNYKVTPCFASSIFHYLNINLDCYMIYNKFRTDINHYYNIKPKIPEKMYLPSKITKENGKKMFTPCNHPGSCFKNKKCTCYKNNISCEMSCLCTHCDLTLKCDCKICDHNCICYKNNRNCSCHEECTNKLNKTKKVMICDSNIAGLGLFANEDIKKNEFVIEYIGEVIGHSEAERRGFFYDHKKLSYLFDFNCDDADYQTIDATRIGNEARFINHSGKPNLVARQIKVDGVFKMGFYAIENIKKGEEMYFDYKYNDEFKKKYNIHD